jgi:prepilin-type N-terminal cleavage/methylation domain-containing protein
MRRFRREEGFTLVEVLVALAILSIIIMAFTTLFTSSFSGIFRAGRKSASLYEAQAVLDQVIDQGTALTEDEINILFGGIVIKVQGEEITEAYEYDGRTGQLVYFLPK